MLDLKKIAVTGGLSSGKSSVCRFFKEHGAYVISADEIVHYLLSPTTELGKKVVSLLGEDIITQGQINRAKVADKIFHDAELLKKTENLLHPAVREEILSAYRKVSEAESTSLFIAEIPLLYEAGMDKDFDYVISVVADREKSIERFQLSTTYGPEEFQKRMTRQLEPEKKAARADIVIHNNGSLAELKQTVIDIFQKLNPTI